MTTKYMCLFWKYICPLFLTTQLVALIASEEITFNCDNTGNINSIAQVGVDQEQILIQKNGKYCHYSEQTCKDENKKAPLHVLIQSEKQLKIMGGNPNNIKHYLLECQNEYDVTAKAIPFSAKPITTMTTPLTKTMSAMNPPTLSLKIKKNKTELTGDVYIGETLTLEMSNVQGFRVYPKKCIAENRDDETDYVVIWTAKNSSSSNPCSVYDNAIITEKWKYHSTSKTTTISFYAFQFISSTHVTIRCSAHLCSDSTPTCTTSCMDTPIADRRRRRDSPLLKKEQPITRTEEAQVSFTVLSESVVQNKANALSVRLTVIITAVIFGERIMRFI